MPLYLSTSLIHTGHRPTFRRGNCAVPSRASNSWMRPGRGNTIHKPHREPQRHLPAVDTGLRRTGQELTASSLPTTPTPADCGVFSHLFTVELST